MQTHPDVLDRREELTELTADLPVMLLVSENRSASFSSAAYVPSMGLKYERFIITKCHKMSPDPIPSSSTLHSEK